MIRFRLSDQSCRLRLTAPHRLPSIPKRVRSGEAIQLAALILQKVELGEGVTVGGVGKGYVEQTSVSLSLLQTGVRGMALILRFENGDHLAVVAKQVVHSAGFTPTRLLAYEVYPAVSHGAALYKEVLTLDLSFAPSRYLDLRIDELCSVSASL